MATPALKTVGELLPELPPLAKLRSPFPDNQISKLPKETRKQIDERNADKSKMLWGCKVCGGYHHKDAIHLDYVGHAALTDRLLDTDIEWSWEPVGFTTEGLPAHDKNGGLWIKLTVCGVTRYGYGAADGKSGGDAVKEIIGDALRNAAMRFGAALDLWHKGDLHLETDDTPEPKVDNGNGHAERAKTDRDAPFPQGPAKNKTECKDMGRKLWADVMACEDVSTLDALLISHKPLIDQLKEGLPQWWGGGTRDGEAYEGLGQVIEKLERDFEGVAASGMDMRGNTVEA